MIKFKMNKHITSLQNPLVKEWISIKEKPRSRKRTGLFLIEGKREIEMAQRTRKKEAAGAGGGERRRGGEKDGTTAAAGDFLMQGGGIQMAGSGGVDMLSAFVGTQMS